MHAIIGYITSLSVCVCVCACRCAGPAACCAEPTGVWVGSTKTGFICGGCSDCALQGVWSVGKELQ